MHDLVYLIHPPPLDMPHPSLPPSLFHSQQRIPQRTPDQTTTRPNRLLSALLLQTRIDLDEIHRDQLPALVDALGDVVALAEGQAAADGRPRGGCPLGVEGVDVEGEVDRGVGADVGEGELHDAPDAVAVDVVHAEGADPVGAQEVLFGPVHVPQADVDELAGGEWGRVGGEPGEGEGRGRGWGGAVCGGGCAVGAVGRGGTVGGGGGGGRVNGGGEAGQERNGHAVDVTAEGDLGSVDVRMGINPDDSDFSSETLADRLGGAGDGANGYAVVSTKREHEPAGFGVGVYLLAQLLRHRRDSARVLHATVVWVGLGPQAAVVVDLVVAMEVVAEFVAQLVEETGRDESVGGGVDAGFALAATEADGDDAELGGSGEELGTDR